MLADESKLKANDLTRPQLVLVLIASYQRLKTKAAVQSEASVAAYYVHECADKNSVLTTALSVKEKQTPSNFTVLLYRQCHDYTCWNTPIGHGPWSTANGVLFIYLFLGPWKYVFI